MTSIIQCAVFVLILTANILSLKAQSAEASKNSFHHVEPTHYMPPFTKYYHKRDSHTNKQFEQTVFDENKISLFKRSIPSDIDFLDKSGDFGSSNQIGKNDGKTNFDIEMRKHKVKNAKVYVEPPTTKSPILPIKCLYKIHKIALSATPIESESNPQDTIQSENFGIPGAISETTLPSGETVKIEECAKPGVSCYTLWYDGDGNTTVLGQGCWYSSLDPDKNNCDKCTRVNPRLPATKFCCCTTDYCNGDFLSIREEIITPKAESAQDLTPETNYGNLVGAAVVAIVGVLVVCVAAHMIYCRPKPEITDQSEQLEKVDVVCNGGDAMATGLLCVDNLTLHEHIGQGKFGSVWRGNLGSTPVAVKMYSNVVAWHKESTIYAMAGLAHENILKFYGSDNRPRLTGGWSREHLLVLELCPWSLRRYLETNSLSWREFSTLAHGVAAGLAYLHTATPVKPCIVHRDVNSNNVLVASDGTARLADLGLGQVLRVNSDPTMTTPYTEAGTIRYLSPEALEGALDLCGARGALCAVDVYALGLVLWELLWRTRPAHHGNVPEYELPYGNLGNKPTLTAMQNLVSRNKARPPLPQGPDSRPLRIASNTCEECWDHDAEARLTAICVEERMSELSHILQTPAPLIHHNIPSNGDSSHQQSEFDKNSNCVTQRTESTIPLLHPHIIGRNACIQRNTHTDVPTNNTLIHKSLKDITVPNEPGGQRVDNQENCLSVARVNRSRIVNDNANDIQSFQRPIEYVPNDVTGGVKQTNLQVETTKPKWGIRRFFERKTSKPKLETEVVLQDSVALTKTSIVDKSFRPTNLVLDDRVIFNMEGPCLSPPNRTLSPTMFSEINTNEKVFGFKELPQSDCDGRTNQIFAVIVPKGIPTQSTSNSDSLKKSTNSSQSVYKNSFNSESGDSTFKKRLSSDNKIITNSSNSGRSSRASINLELQYLDSQNSFNDYDLNSDCSSLEDEHLMLLSENGGSKITMQLTKDKNEILKECPTDFAYNKQNKYTNFENEISDGQDKENYVDNPVYLACVNGDMEEIADDTSKAKQSAIKRQRSLEQVSEIFSSAGDVRLQNPANRVKTPGDLPVAIRKARRDKFRKSNECNRLSLYDDRIMFGNSL